MNSLRTRLLAVTVALVFVPLFGPSTAAAGQPITFVHEGTARNGFRLDGEVFLGAWDFIITAFGDVGDRESSATGWWIDHSGATIEIVGFGTFGILTPTRTFVNSVGGRVGFSRGGQGGTDLFTGPTHPDFLDWDMTTSIGSISGNDGRLAQWNMEPLIETTGGILIFDNEEDLPVTFTAEVIPGPAPIALLPIAALLCPRRRRRPVLQA